MSTEPATEVVMPTEEEMLDQFMKHLEVIELAATGHQESIDFVVWFAKETVMASVAMFDSPEAKAMITRYMDETHNIKVVDKEVNDDGAS